MKIDLVNTKAYHGLGDLVMWAWIAEGYGRGRIAFHTTRSPELTAMLGLRVDPDPGGATLDDAYRAEIADRGRRPRVDYVRQALGIAEAPCRPCLDVPAESADWAEGRLRAWGRAPVVLFPQTAWRPREWPPAYWIDLAWAMQSAGVPAVVMLSDRDERYANVPVYMWGVPVTRLAALMQRSLVVVGNDSFPAHLGGVVGTPTIALLGPTRATVFSHATNVECLATASLPCTGCHFNPPFRPACDQGCQSLYRLYPDDVLARVMRHVTGTVEPEPGRVGAVVMPG